MPTYDWQPHPGPQEDFLGRGEFEVLFGGAAGPGKTDALIMDPLHDIDHSRFRGIIFRRTFPQLQEIIDRCFVWYPHLGGIYRATEHRWYFPSGALIQLAHMQHENDKYSYQGKEYHWIGFDELTQFSESQYLYLHSRSRSTIAELEPKCRATTNPGGTGHTWVKKRFIDGYMPRQTYLDEKSGQSRVYIPATVYDNPTLVNNDPDYVRRLEGLPEIEKLRLLHGVWDVFEGQVFTELSARVHGVEPFEIPPEWERYMVFDWGYARPWCALWFALDYDGTIYLYREFYGMADGNPNLGLRQSNQEICRVIHQIETGRYPDCPFPAERGRIRMRVADPACWSPTKIRGSNSLHGPSFYEDANREGLNFVKADNNRLLGKQQFHQRLRLDEEIDKTTGEVLDEHPRFVAFLNCKNWWREIPDLRASEKDIEDVDTDQPDEGYDCTRYMFMARPISPRVEQHGPPVGSFAAERNKMIRARKMAKTKGISLQDAYARVR